MTRPARWYFYPALVSVMAGVVDPAAHSKPATTDPVFEISGADSSLNAETLVILTTAHADLESASGVGLQDTVRVVYVLEEQSFDSVIGGRFPDWGVAAALGDQNLIAIRSPADYPLGRSLAEILRHELAHLHLDALAELRAIPRWLHEGYAQQFAHQWRFGDDWIIARAAFTDQVLPLRDIDGVNSFRSVRAQLAYAQSYLAAGYLLKTYGWKGLLEFTRAVREGADWDGAFFTAIGTDYDGFQQEYITHINERYNWAAFLGDTVLLWLGLVGVFLILYLIKRYRSARKKKEWEREEAIEDILYSPFGDPSRRPPEDGAPSG